LGATLRSTPPDTRGGKSISGTQKRRQISKGVWGQKSGGDFFIKKELNITQARTHFYSLSILNLSA